MSGTEEDREGRTKTEIPCQAPSDTTKAGSRSAQRSAEPSPTRHSPRTNPAPRGLCGSALSLSVTVPAAALQETAGTARRSRSEPPCVRAESRQYSPRPASQLPSPITSCSPRPHALRPLVLTPSSSHHLVLSSHPALSRREAAPVS